MVPRTLIAPATPTLLHALTRFDREPLPRQSRRAVDLGCGAGGNTIELLRRGWRVLAVDEEDPEAIAALRRHCDPRYRRRLRTRVLAIGEQRLPTVDLINVSSALAQCPGKTLPFFWSTIIAALRPGGRFAGQLVGERDAVLALVQCFEVELFHEQDEIQHIPGWDDGPPTHVFRIVARRSPAADSEAG